MGGGDGVGCDVGGTEGTNGLGLSFITLLPPSNICDEGSSSSSKTILFPMLTSPTLGSCWPCRKEEVIGEAKGDRRSASILCLIALAMPPVVVGDPGIASSIIPKPPAFTAPGCGVYSAAEDVAVVAVIPGEGEEKFQFVCSNGEFSGCKICEDFLCWGR